MKTVQTNITPRSSSLSTPLMQMHRAVPYQVMCLHSSIAQHHLARLALSWFLSSPTVVILCRKIKYSKLYFSAALNILNSLFYDCCSRVSRKTQSAKVFQLHSFNKLNKSKFVTKLANKIVWGEGEIFNPELSRQNKVLLDKREKILILVKLLKDSFVFNGVFDFISNLNSSSCIFRCISDQ